MAISNNVRRAMAEGGWIRRMFEIGIAMKAEYGDDQVFDLANVGEPAQALDLIGLVILLETATEYILVRGLVTRYPIRFCSEY